MARILPGPTIAGISGKLGGVIFSRNASSSYCRAYARPSNPRTSYQSLQRALVGNAPTIWRGMTSSLRSDWATYAADAAQALTDPFGETYYASGYNWFLRINAHRVSAAQAPSTAVPTIATPATPTISTFSPTTEATGTSEITYPSAEFSGYYCAVFVARNPSTGFDVRTSRWTLLAAYTSPGATSTDIQSDLETRFPNVQVGERYTVQVHRQTTEGRRSSPARIAANVAS